MLGRVVRVVLLPKQWFVFWRAVAQAAKKTMQVHTDYYKSFHLFGYDFLIDADLRVWLCEINAR